MERVNTWVQKYAIYIIGVAMAIITMWLDSKYVSQSEFNKLSKELENLQNEFSRHEQKNDLMAVEFREDLETLGGRLDKKIKVINLHTEEIDQNENDLIRIKERIK